MKNQELFLGFKVQLITLACSTAALVPRAVCASLRSPVQRWKNMGTVSSRRENWNVPPVLSKKKHRPRRRRNYIPSLPVVKNYMHRPVSSSKKIYTVPSHREKNCLPSRPVVTMCILYTVPCRHQINGQSRLVEKIQTHRPVPSNPGNYNFHYFNFPSCPVFKHFPAEHVKTVPSRPVSNITNHEKPWIWAMHRYISYTGIYILRI